MIGPKKCTRRDRQKCCRSVGRSVGLFLGIQFKSLKWDTPGGGGCRRERGSTEVIITGLVVGKHTPKKGPWIKPHRDRHSAEIRCDQAPRLWSLSDASIEDQDQAEKNWGQAPLSSRCIYTKTNDERERRRKNHFFSQWSETKAAR